MTPGYKIRLAQASDRAAISQCARAAYAKYIQRIGRAPAPMVADFASQIIEQKVRVLVVAEAVCGFIVSYPKAEFYFLENIAVDPKYQSCGYGVVLLRYVEQLGAGFGVVRLYTNEAMSENLCWYKKQGYTETGRRREDGFSRVYFEKRLPTDKSTR